MRHLKSRLKSRKLYFFSDFFEDIGDVVKHKFEAVESKIKIAIYSSQRTDIKYTDDPNLDKKADLEISVPENQDKNQNGANFQQIFIEFSFGKIELMVEAKTETGDPISTILDFSSSL